MVHGSLTKLKGRKFWTTELSINPSTGSGLVNSLVVRKGGGKMDKIPLVVFIKSKEGRKVKIKGEKALATIEAVKMVLEERGIPQRGPIQMDPMLPDTFDLAETVALAIAWGHRTPEDIADFIEREIQRHL